MSGALWIQKKYIFLEGYVFLKKLATCHLRAYIFIK